MPLLAVDVGNAHTVLGVIDDGEVSAEWRVATDERRTADEWAVLLRGLGGPHLDQPGALRGVALCATVPSVLHAWRDMLARHHPELPTVVVGPGTRTGVPILVDHPREVGSDRIVNAVAVTERHGGPAAVVDLGGTATTFDVVDHRGRYVGGAIAPGLELSLQALGRAGAQLRMVEPARPRAAIGKNTVEALQSGMVLGLASQVDGLVARILRELGADGDGEAQVVATGHLAPLVLEECTCFTDHDPWLTLRGLEIVFSRNAPRR